MTQDLGYLKAVHWRHGYGMGKPSFSTEAGEAAEIAVRGATTAGPRARAAGPGLDLRASSLELGAPARVRRCDIKSEAEDQFQFNRKVDADMMGYCQGRARENLNANFDFAVAPHRTRNQWRTQQTVAWESNAIEKAAVVGAHTVVRAKDLKTQESSIPFVSRTLSEPALPITSESRCAFSPKTAGRQLADFHDSVGKDLRSAHIDFSHGNGRTASSWATQQAIAQARAVRGARSPAAAAVADPATRAARSDLRRSNIWLRGGDATEWTSDSRQIGGWGPRSGQPTALPHNLSDPAGVRGPAANKCFPWG
mmetsp:Transcript_7443/g.18729  ORF Transcript_7443/g.18729 Transcript_7443/m.18729 type:complete len:310 (+) Transcript_7443:64-993(+)